VAPKFEPETVTDVPIGPELGVRLVILGTTFTTKFIPLLAIPPTVTTTLPVVAPTGTVTAMLVGLQLVGVAARPLKVTVLVLWDAPKLAPEIVTEDPTAPLFGLRELMLGDVTVKGTALLVTPPTMTVTFPVMAPAGTGTTIVVWLQLVGVVAPVPGNATALDPCVEPKLVPVMVTEVPAEPEFGFKAVIVTGVTVKLKLLLAKPPTVTTSGPVVAPDGTSTVAPVSIQLCIVAGVPLNVTVSPVTKAPKFVPGMEIESPTVPEGGVTFVMAGATVKGTALLRTPFAAITTFPVDAPDGTGTVMLVGLQLVGVARVRLKVTVLDPWDAPKFVPLMVTKAPTWAPAGVMLVMFGVGKTANATALLATPPTVTMTLPLIAPLGTKTLMLVALQFVGAAAEPLNVTVLVP